MKGIHFMLGKIAHYPAPLRGQVGEIIRHPLVSQGEIGERDYRLAHETGEPIAISREALSSPNGAWIGAPASTCFIMAIVARNGSDEIEAAKVGHFPATFSIPKFDRFLRSTGNPAENISIGIAGMAQRPFGLLKGSVECLVRRVGSFGIPLSLSWEKGAIPVLTDDRSGCVISDLGLAGKLHERTWFGRQVSFGVMSRNWVLVSTVHNMYQMPSWLYTTLLTEDLGTMIHDH